jgi:hypothetical protein
MAGEKVSRDFIVEGICETAAGGEAIVERNFPNLTSISGVGGGYLLLISIQISLRNDQGERSLPRDIRIIPTQEIRDEDLILILLISVCEDIGSLNGLRVVAEDVVDE